MKNRAAPADPDLSTRVACGPAGTAEPRAVRGDASSRRIALMGAACGPVTRQGHIRGLRVPGASRSRAALWLAAVILAIAIAPAAAENQPPATAPLRQLRFSPDGRYVLVQDEAEVTVLTAHPLAILFRIPAHDARDVQFTPDSRQVVFVSSTSHLQRWSVAARTRAAMQDLPVTACGTERLSPDARFLACVDPQGTLRLVDAKTGETSIEVAKYGRQLIDFTRLDSSSGDGTAGVVQMDPSRARVDFSPDSRFFLAAPALPIGYLGGEDLVIARDLRAGRAIRDRGGLILLRTGSSVDYFLPPQYFAFVTPDRLMISDPFWVKDGVVTARLVAFPSGKEISKPKLPMGPLFRAADPAFVIIRPFGPLPKSQPDTERGYQLFRPPTPQPGPANQRAAAVEIATGEVIISETPALDVFGRYYVAEPSPGVVGLYERGKGLQATIPLHQK